MKTSIAIVLAALTLTACMGPRPPLTPEVYLKSTTFQPAIQLPALNCERVQVYLYDRRDREIGLAFDDTGCAEQRLALTAYTDTSGARRSFDEVNVKQLFYRFVFEDSTSERCQVLPEYGYGAIQIEVDSCMPLTGNLYNVKGEKLGSIVDDTICGWWGCSESELQAFVDNSRINPDDSTDLQPGVYFFVLKTGDSTLVTKKLLLMK
ncbi:MAG: hypothetical protein KKA42_15510 [candidate division Zixibacteria bacterium]|nr:hypothetical protein [candidate division Zixibacteria bacterium]